MVFDNIYIKKYISYENINLPLKPLHIKVECVTK